MQWFSGSKVKVMELMEQSKTEKSFFFGWVCAHISLLALLGPIPTVLNIDLCTTWSVYVNIFWHCWDLSQQRQIFTYAQLGSVHTYISWCGDSIMAKINPD